jgi:hypothetical protein
MANLFENSYTADAAVLSKIQIGDTTYLLKDKDVRAILATLGSASLKDVSANGVAAGEEGLVTGAQVQAAIAGVTGVLTLKGKVDALPEDTTGYSNGDVIFVGDVEYVAYEDSWIELGDEGSYVPKTRTVATLGLDQDITVSALQTALGLGKLAYKDSASGTVAGQTISGVKATGTSAGSIEVGLTQSATAATLTTASYTPEGKVAGSTTAAGSVGLAATESTDAFQVTGTVGAQTVTVTPSTGSVNSITDVGSQASYTQGTFSAGSLPSFTQGSKASWTANVDDETLSFSFTANGDDSFSQGTLPSHADDSFTANNLPTKEAVTVATGITSASVSQPTFTGGRIAATFTGSSSDISATFTGTEKADAIVTGVSYDKASVDADATKFTGSSITLDVGDITVASKDVTVQ